MPRFDNPNDGDAETRRLLNEVLGDVIRQALPVATPANFLSRRRWFSIGLMLLVPLCLVAAVLFWIQSDWEAVSIWIGFSLVLLMVGAWQFDKASKESVVGRPESPSSSGDDTASKKAPLRRVQ
jgi:hypothetical protein